MGSALALYVKCAVIGITPIEAAEMIVSNRPILVSVSAVCVFFVILSS